VLELAHRCTRLRSFVHVSSAYANLNRPPGSTVREALYPLRWGDTRADHGQLVAELMELPPKAAAARADVYMLVGC
jgi:hypothetical protein